jgi:hypothetical protein
MGQARHPLSLALVLLVASPFATLVSSCGSSGESSSSSSSPGGGGAATATPPAPAGASAQSCAGTVAGVSRLRVTGAGCAVGRGVTAVWANESACATPPGASRVSCRVKRYHCLGAATDRGLAVSCAGPGRSISFDARRG